MKPGCSVTSKHEMGSWYGIVLDIDVTRNGGYAMVATNTGDIQYHPVTLLSEISAIRDGRRLVDTALANFRSWQDVMYNRLSHVVCNLRWPSDAATETTPVPAAKPKPTRAKKPAKKVTKKRRPSSRS